MPETVSISPQYHIDQDGYMDVLYFITNTDPKHFFTISVERRKLYVDFGEPEDDFTILRQLELVAGMLNGSSNFKDMVSLYTSYGRDEISSIRLKIDENHSIVVKRESDLQDLAKNYYIDKDFIVFDGDTEFDILDRARKIEAINNYVSQRFGREVMDPYIEEKCSRSFFFYEEDYEKFSKEGEKKMHELFEQYLENFQFDPVLTGMEERLYLDAAKAEFKDDYQLRDIILKEAKEIRKNR